MIYFLSLISDEFDGLRDQCGVDRSDIFHRLYEHL